MPEESTKENAMELNWSNVDPPKRAKVLYSYIGSDRHELTIKENDIVEILEEMSGWYRGKVVKEGQKTSYYGIFPASYVLLTDEEVLPKSELFKRKLKLKCDAYSNPKIMYKITKSIVQWTEKLNSMASSANFENYKQLLDTISEIIEYRTQLLSSTITSSEKDRIQKLAMNKVAKGRKILGMDLTPYSEEGRRLHFENTPIIRLYSAHQNLEIDYEGAQDDPLQMKKVRKVGSILHGVQISKPAPPPASTYHLYVNFKCLIAKLEPVKNPDTEILIYIYDLENKKQISEGYQVNLGTSGIKDLGNLEFTSAIFTNISPDLWKSGKYYLVCRIVKMTKLSADHKNGEILRRPGLWSFECLTSIRNHSAPLDFSLLLYSPINEFNFGKGPHSAIRNTGNYSVVEMGALAISCRMIRGDLLMHLNSEPNLKKATICPKLEIPDCLAEKIIPINDLYITLIDGIFLQEKKYNSFEIVISLRKPNGDLVRDCCSVGEGEVLSSSFRSIVYHHHNFPAYTETMRIRINEKEEEIERSVIYFEIRQWSSKEKLPETKFASILPLFKDCLFVPNEKQNLSIFKTKNVQYDIPAFHRNELKYESVEKYRLSVETNSLSTIFPQNAVLSNLLNWKVKPETLADSLNKITFVPIESILQFIIPIFNTLIEILENIPKIRMFAYNTLIFVLNLIIDDKKTDRYVHLLKRLKDHIDHIPFSTMECNAKISEVLLESILYYFSKWSSNSHAKYIRSTLRSLPILMKIILVFAQKKTVEPKEVNKVIDNLKGRHCTMVNPVQPSGSILSILSPLAKSLSSLSMKIPDPIDENLEINNENIENNNSNVVIDEIFIKQKFFNIFESLGELMRSSDPVLLAPQTTCLKSLCDILPILSRIFSNEEITSLISNLIKEFPQHSSPTPTLNIQKLLFISSVINHDFYLSSYDITEKIVPHLLTVISEHMDYQRTRNESLDSSRCLIVLLDAIQMKSRKKQKLMKLFAPIIAHLSKAILSLHKENEINLDIVTSFISILHGMSTIDFNEYLSSLHQVFKFDIIKSLSNTLFILLNQSYPPSWVTMKILLCKVIVNSVKVMADHLTRVYDEKPENLPFIDFLQLCFEFLKLKLLNFEAAQQAKTSILTILSNGDMRMEVVEIMRRLWYEIGELKLNFISSLVEPIVSLLLVDNLEIQKMAIEMYCGLLKREFEICSNFSEMSSKTVESFCQISKVEGISKCNTSLLIHHISEIFENFENEELKSKGLLFISHLKQLVDLLLESEQIPDGIEWEDERTVATFKVMEFLKDTKHPDPYVKYIHQLSYQHKKANRFIEAGLTLLLHAQLLSFSSHSILKPFMKLPQAKEFERKEKLYYKAVAFFDRGKDWERSVGLLEEMTRSLPPNYEKMAKNLRMQAEFYEKIVKSERYSPEYFRVCFYGKFPPSLKGQEFIYRGFECERITSFISRMGSLFPNAETISSNDPISDDIINGDRQWMVIATVYVSSIGEMNREKFIIDRSLPLYIRKYQKLNNVNVLTFSRPFTRPSNSSSDNNEFKNLWTKLYFLKTEETFPAILSRSKVIQRLEVDLNPIESAIQSIDAKNNQILDICALHDDPENADLSINNLTLALNGFIDAEVNGGVKKYQQAFFNDECLQEYENAAVLVQQLKDLLRESVVVLGNALETHRRKCPENLLKLQEKLDVFYDRMKNQILEIC